MGHKVQNNIQYWFHAIVEPMCLSFSAHCVKIKIIMIIYGRLPKPHPLREEGDSLLAWWRSEIALQGGLCML